MELYIEFVKIITDSYHSKNTMITQFEFLKNKNISVYYCPNKITYISENISEEIKQKTLKKYILLISANRFEKNVVRTMLAIDELIESKLLEKNIIIIGKIKEKIKDKLKNKNQFIFLNYVENEELEYLYRNCYLFIFPTISEGFGYPPLEVMKYKKPVISSAITSTTEILGDAVIYFNPFSKDEIKTRIYYLDNDKKEYENRKRKSYLKYKEILEIQKKDLVQITKEILMME